MTDILTMDEYAEEVKKRLTKKADFPAAICGLPGTGKSTFQIELSRRIDSDFGIERNLIFDPDPKKIMQKVTHELPPGAAVGLDEGIRAANRRKAYDPLNVFLSEYFALCRKDFKAIFLCVPSVHQIDSGIRDQRIIHWVEIIKRGIAVVFARSRVPGLKDPFRIKVIEKYLSEFEPGKRDIDLTDEDILKACSASKNFAFLVKFDPMPPALEKEYEEAAARMRKELKVPELSGKAAHYKLIVQKMLAERYEEGFTIADLMGKYALGRGTVFRFLKAEGVTVSDKKMKELQGEAYPDS